MTRSLSLSRYLARLGYGTRREVEAMITARRVHDAHGAVLRDGPAPGHEHIRVDGAPLDPPPGSVLLLHKPVGYVCSTSDRPPLVYDLLPSRLPHRDPVMAPVGRLDADTSGLLLFTDDGALNHRLTSPRSHVPKRYRATLAEPLSAAAAEQIAGGTMVLHGETTPLKPAELEHVSDRVVVITLHEGRYHQVRRMFAAVGNHVAALERVAFGTLTLGDLPSGAWRVLRPEEVRAISAVPAAGG